MERRMKRSDGEQYQVFNLLLYASQHEMLKLVAATQKASMASILRAALEEWFERHSQKPPGG
jgi:hypothetical protein